jgi:asparagine synthase (glutamine-hydrolysing)
MCGIAGIVHSDLEPATSRLLVERMCEEIAHRGPDDSGIHVEPGAVLGMRRLSIIDIAGGHQPMESGDGRKHLVFNGEIYNYRELRRELEQHGCRFRTASDTEVLLQLLERRGSDGFDALNGMFALALWDSAERSLLLARDRLGVKPLYYAWDGRRLAFASEIKALIASRLVERELEPEALWHYLTFRYIPPPLTIWRNVFKLPPGHYLTFGPRRDGPVIRRWWDIPYPGMVLRQESDAVLDREFAALFEDSVRLRLIADVPVGVMLSGGLDSSAVAAATKACGAQLETFSIGFRGAAEANELPYAREVARHLGNRHHEIEIDEQDYVGFLGDFVRFIDEPMADPASIPLYYVSRLAAERVKVVLSGEGSDEILGGYDFDLWVGAWARRAASEAAAAPVGFAAWLRGRRSPPPQAAMADLRRDWPPPNMTNYMGSEEKQRLLGRAAPYQDSMQIVAGDLARIGAQPPLHQLLYTFSQSWLAEDLLMKADKMSMATSIELRTPFLDFRLVEWAARTAPEVKVGPGPDGKLVTKRPLRRYAQSRLPRSIIERPKQGFPVPLYGWLGERLRGWAEDLMLGTEARLKHVFDAAELRARVDRGVAADGDILDRHRLWNLLVLELWTREWRPV